MRVRPSGGLVSIQVGASAHDVFQTSLSNPIRLIDAIHDEIQRLHEFGGLCAVSGESIMRKEAFAVDTVTIVHALIEQGVIEGLLLQSLLSYTVPI